MIPCPRCSSVHLRAHAPIQRIEWRKRHGWFGAVVPRGTTVAVELSCGDCLHAFTSFPDGSFKQAPLQQAYEALAAAQKQLAEKGPNDGKDAEARPSRPQARPAPDPRQRKR